MGIKGIATAALRTTGKGKAKISQGAYWTRFGVTQSGASRYENGRDVPLPLAILHELHATGIVSDEQLAKAKKDVLKKAAKTKK